MLNYDLLNNLPEGKSQNHSIFLHIDVHVCIQPTSKPYVRKMGTFQFQPEIVTARNAKDTKD